MSHPPEAIRGLREPPSPRSPCDHRPPSADELNRFNGEGIIGGQKGPKVPFLEWEPKYSVQNAEIDRQHQEWFALISGVHKALLTGAGKEILRTLLAETTQYTFVHFSHEEELMDETDYPDRQHHILEHQELANRAREFADRFESGQNATTLEYLVFLADWVKDHTRTTDRELGQYLLLHPID